MYFYHYLTEPSILLSGYALYLPSGHLCFCPLLPFFTPCWYLIQLAAVKSYCLVIFNLFYLVYIEFILWVLPFSVSSWKISVQVLGLYFLLEYLIFFLDSPKASFPSRDVFIVYAVAIKKCCLFKCLCVQNV